MRAKLNKKKTIKKINIPPSPDTLNKPDKIPALIAPKVLIYLKVVIFLTKLTSFTSNISSSSVIYFSLIFPLLFY
jgi:hypothetical protein